jgi:hypothetical protein
MSPTPTNRAIHAALNQLMAACGLTGESGTERLFMNVLCPAIGQVEADWDIVDDSHAQGLCFDVNAMLADAIEQQLALTRPTQEQA